MARTGFARLGAITFGIWFAIAVAGQVSVLRCPVHDAPQGSHHTSQHNSQRPTSHSHHCHCIEHCCGVAVAVPAEIASTPLAVPPLRTHGGGAWIAKELPSALDYRVVFPTGPPSPSALIA